MFAAILVLAFLKNIIATVDKIAVSFSAFATAHKIAFGVFAANFVNLIYLGSSPAAAPYVVSSKVSTGVYFGYFLLILPLLAFLNKAVLAEAEKVEVKAETIKPVSTKILSNTEVASNPNATGVAVTAPISVSALTHVLIPLLVIGGESSGSSTK